MDKYPYFLYFLSFPLVSVKSVIFVLELNYMILLDSDINLILNLKFLKKKKKHTHKTNKQLFSISTTTLVKFQQELPH